MERRPVQKVAYFKRLQWDNKKAYEHAEYNLALQKGKTYLKTGNLKDLGLSVVPGFIVTGNAGKGKTIHALDDCLDERLNITQIRVDPDQNLLSISS